MAQAEATFKYAEHGAKIRAARVNASLSHDRLAALIGSSRQHLIKLEKGQHRARPAMLDKIADATGTPKQDLEAADDDEESEQDMRAKAELFDALAARVADIIAERQRTHRSVA